jgi:RHS repeat-associated protein
VALTVALRFLAIPGPICRARRNRKLERKKKMKKSPLLQLLWMSVVLCLLTNLSFAQSDGLGLQPYGTYSGDVNLGIGNLNLTIPLFSLSGRDGHDLNVSMSYNSKAWVYTPHYSHSTGQLLYNTWELSPGAFWRLPLATTMHSELVTTGSINPGTFELKCWEHYVVTLPDGSSHSFPDVKTRCSKSWCVYPQGNSCGVETGPAPEYEVHTGPSLDHAMLMLHVENFGTSGPTLSFPDGHKITACNGNGWSPEDSNGNCITINGTPDPNTGDFTTGTITDTVGRNFVVSQTGQPNTEAIQYTDSNGTQQNIYINYSPTTLTPTFNSAPNNPTKNANLVSSIVLPNGRSYTFQHNNFGELTQITYPTGGYTRYDYGTFQTNLTPADERWVVAKHVCRRSDGACTPGVDEDDTTYSPALTYWNGYSFTTGGNTVIEAAGTSAPRKAFYQFTGDQYSGPMEALKVIYNPDGSTAETVTTEYSSPGSVGLTQLIRPIRKTTTLANGFVKKSEWDYDTFNSGIPVPDDNILNEREYDWGYGAAGALLRTTHNDWIHTNPVNGVDYTSPSIYMLNRKADTIVYDAGGNVVAQTFNDYDYFGLLSDLGGAPQHDNNYSTAYTTRGNLTHVWRWLNTNNTYITSAQNYYDDLGNLRQTTDANGNSTYFDYSNLFDDFGCLIPNTSPQAWLTGTTNALGQSTLSAHYACTGLLEWQGDQNDINANRANARFTYDSMNRVSGVSSADGGQTNHFYQDTPSFNAPYVYQQEAVDANTTAHSWTQVDGLGRPIRSAKLNGEAGPNVVDDVDTCYDALGRKSFVTYPYQMSGWMQGSYHCPPDAATPPGDSFTYDALGRVTRVTHSDGSHVDTDYSQFPVVTGTDEAGKRRRNQTDALGRLIAVWEPDANGNLSYETDYQYDTLDNLVRVDQKGGDPDPANWRTRTFAYDSLSRLIQANNPESGTITYAYDNAGNLISKTAPAPNQFDPSVTVTTSYAYDALNRLTSKSFSTGGGVVYVYDQSNLWGVNTQNSIGRLSALYNFVPNLDPSITVTTAISYDVMGRPAFERTWNWRSNGAPTQDFSYTYDLDGSLSSVQYPTGRTISYKYNAAQRPVWAKDLTNNINFVTNATYTASGALSSLVNGSTATFAGITTTNSYDSRLQPVFLTASSPAGTIFNLGYDFHLGADDNGNVYAVNNNKVFDHTRDQSFTYDQLNRLVSAQNAGTDCSQQLPDGQTRYWGESYGYDAWGNMTSRNVTKCSAEGSVPGANAKNQMNGMVYDAAGNLVTGGYSYDAENQLISASLANVKFDYDADGRRVQKSNGTLYWYADGDNVLEETNLSGALKAEYIFFGGQRIARRDPSGAVHYYFADHLGSTDIVTSATGTVEEESEYYPFGGERGIIDSGIGNNYKFTGKERDPEDGLDDFGARYNTWYFSRFTTPDPTMKSAVLVIPQSWNRYSYVLNNPLRYIDPNGELWVSSGNSADPYSWVDTCGQKQTCYEQIATQVGENVIIYGPNDANDKQTISPNDYGYIDLDAVAGASGAYFKFQSGVTAIWGSPQTAVDLYNAASDYHKRRPNDGKLSLNDTGEYNGELFPPHATHDLGRSIDMRYIDENGKEIAAGDLSVEKADDNRMRDLVNAFEDNGFNQNYSDNNVNLGTEWATKHKNHIHMGKTKERGQCEIGATKCK